MSREADAPPPCAVLSVGDGREPETFRPIADVQPVDLQAFSAPPAVAQPQISRAFARGCEVIAQAVDRRRDQMLAGTFHQAVVVPIGDAYVRACSCGVPSIAGYGTFEEAFVSECPIQVAEREFATRLLQDGPAVIDALRDAALRARAEQP